MRNDNFVKDVLERCEALKTARLWAAEPKIRPRAWLHNFDEADRWVAAELLSRFTFYNQTLTELLFLAAYRSLFDGLPKGPNAPARDHLIAAAERFWFTSVEGEQPNKSDSGNFFARITRQLLKVPQARILDRTAAIQAAYQGEPICFVDDFIGSGDQFVGTWTRETQVKSNSLTVMVSFQRAAKENPRFVAVYICPIATEGGLNRIHAQAPTVAVSTTHVLDKSCGVAAIQDPPAVQSTLTLQQAIQAFLAKYQGRLRPKEHYLQTPQAKTWGYRNLGQLFAFEHSVPDATLPIFWSAGDTEKWTPLIERT